jgi:hypothetical protein
MMATLPKPSTSGGFLRKLPLLRPRFVYLSIRARELKIPLFLVVPLSLLELALWTSVWILDGRKLFAQSRLELVTSFGSVSWGEQTRQAARGLAKSITALRAYESFGMVEVEAEGGVSVKIGLW